MGSYLIFQAQKNSKASGESIILTFDPPNNALSTTVKGKPSASMVVRGYMFQITFDVSKVSITDIKYRLGNVSNDLGDDNSTLEDVNKNGVIKIQGEIQAPTGQVLGANSADVANITFVKKGTSPSTLSIKSDSARFYAIDLNGALSEIPTTADSKFEIN